MDKTPHLSCKNIELKVGYRVLLSSFNLTLHASETAALIGPNGSGKTTLLRTLAGLGQPAEGEIKVARALFLANIPSFMLDQSVLWNLRFYIEAFGLKKTSKELKASIARVGLAGRENQAARTLSTGQKRRLSLASIDLINPEVVLADEPTVGLDEAGAELCLDIFEKLCTKNKSALLVATHDPKVITWCQREIRIK